MFTGAVDAGGLVDGGGNVGAVVSGGTLVGGGRVVVVLVVVEVVVVLAISAGSPSASIGVTPSSAGRLHAPRTIAMTHSALPRERPGRRIMRAPSASGRRNVPLHQGDLRPRPLRPERWHARPRAPDRGLFRFGGGPRFHVRSARRSGCVRLPRRPVPRPRRPSAPNASPATVRS